MMPLPPGTARYRIESTGEEFYWAANEQLYICSQTGRRLTADQLRQLLPPPPRTAQGQYQADQNAPRSVPTSGMLPGTGTDPGLSPNPSSPRTSNANYVPVTNSRPIASTSSSYGPPSQSTTTGSTWQQPPQNPSQYSTDTTSAQNYQQSSSSYSQSPYQNVSYTQAQQGFVTNTIPSSSSYGPAPYAYNSTSQVPYSRSVTSQSSSTGNSGQQYNQSPAHMRRGSNVSQTSSTSEANIGNRRERSALSTSRSNTGSDPRNTQTSSSRSTPTSNRSTSSPRTSGQLAGPFAGMSLSPVPEQRVAPPPARPPDPYRRGQDQGTGIAYNNFYGPPEQTTDPELRRQYGAEARSFIRGTEGDAERFDSEYRVRKTPRAFFKQGKVFRIFWSEPAGETADETTEITKDQRFGNYIHSKVRRFIVIRENDQYCSAIPIMTYRNQGTSKRGVKKSDFAIVYTGKHPPRIREDERARPGEEPMRSANIRIDPDERGGKLRPDSRVNFGKIYTIEHNVKVKPFGMVSRDSMRELMYHFRKVWEDTFAHPEPMTTYPQQNPAPLPTQQPNVPESGPSSSRQYTREQLRAAIQPSEQTTPTTIPSQSHSIRSNASHHSRSARSVQSARSSHSTKAGRFVRREPSDDENNDSDDDGSD